MHCFVFRERWTQNSKRAVIGMTFISLWFHDTLVNLNKNITSAESAAGGFTCMGRKRQLLAAWQFHCHYLNGRATLAEYLPVIAKSFSASFFVHPHHMPPAAAAFFILIIYIFFALLNFEGTIWFLKKLVRAWYIHFWQLRDFNFLFFLKSIPNHPQSYKTFPLIPQRVEYFYFIWDGWVPSGAWSHHSDAAAHQAESQSQRDYRYLGALSV